MVRQRGAKPNLVISYPKFYPSQVMTPEKVHLVYLQLCLVNRRLKLRAALVIISWLDWVTVAATQTRKRVVGYAEYVMSRPLGE